MMEIWEGRGSGGGGEGQKSLCVVGKGWGCVCVVKCVWGRGQRAGGGRQPGPILIPGSSKLKVNLGVKEKVHERCCVCVKKCIFMCEM